MLSAEKVDHGWQGKYLVTASVTDRQTHHMATSCLQNQFVCMFVGSLSGGSFCFVNICVLLLSAVLCATFKPCVLWNAGF